MRTITLTVVTAALLCGGITSWAQGAGGGRGQGRGGFDPEQMRAQMMERFQERLGASDTEWKVIEPLLADVMEKQRGAAGGRFGGMMFMRRPGGGDQADRGGNRQGRRGVQQGGNETAQELGTLLEEDNPPAAQIKDKLATLRTERKKQEAELKKSREELRKVLTLKQEAMMVLAGFLD